MEPEEGLSGPPCAGARGPSAAAIIGAEDEDFENDIEPTPEEQNSQFQSLELLRQHPLSLMAFLQHVVLQFDSCPVLCYLHVDMMRRMNPKEGRKQFLEFCHLFLDKAGLLRVPIPHHVQFELERTRPELLSEETQRRFLQDIQNFQEPEISRQLEDFRSKRLMGMTPGEQELSELEWSRARDPSGCDSKEKQLAEQLLARLEEMHLTISSDEEKSSVIFGAIVAYMKFLGVRTKGGDTKKSKSNFFRKKISGKEPQGKARKGFSLPGAALWGRDAHSAEFRQSEGLSVTVTPPGGDSAEAEAGTDLLGPSELGDPPSEPPSGEQHAVEEGAESESPEPGGPGGGDPPPFLPRQPEEAVPRLEPELEQEPPAWRQLAAPEALLRLPQRELRRQEVINELFLTEHAHVRMLRVLLELFYQPMLREGFFDEQELSNIFPSLEDLVEVHTVFLDSLKKLREESGFIIAEIGDVLLARFEGTEGSWFQKISARFCSRQSFALEQLKAKQRKDTRFNQFIQEAESRPRCRRLQLKDIIPTEMQRLTKYPLLLLSITKCTEAAAERAKVEQAAECCRQILNHVNQEVRDMENLMKLKDYQRRLDLSNLKQSTDPLLSEFKNTDITKRTLVHEGPLTWRITRDKAVEVQVLLLDDLLVLLQRQEERLVLRWQSRALAPCPDGKQLLSPVVRLRSAMTREVATDHKAFYVIISWENGAQIYELVAPSVSDRKNWCSIISDTAGSLKLPGAQRAKGQRPGGAHGPPGQPDYRDPSENGGGALKEPLPLDVAELRRLLRAGAGPGQGPPPPEQDLGGGPGAAPPEQERRHAGDGAESDGDPPEGGATGGAPNGAWGGRPEGGGSPGGGGSRAEPPPPRWCCPPAPRPGWGQSWGRSTRASGGSRKSRIITGSSSWPSVASSRERRSIRDPPSIQGCSARSRHRRATNAERRFWGAGRGVRTPPPLLFQGDPHPPPSPLCFYTFYINLYPGGGAWRPLPTFSPSFWGWGDVHKFIFGEGASQKTLPVPPHPQFGWKTKEFGKTPNKNQCRF
ncbi:rho guanine nucleotide exchange factor 1 [Poecile atricapillus]|uniref:rho guanine nucleotide exchange factor 1 n=1 Tax=Poecile atricapillus TaxID=48891 RepID=UPI00273A0FFB|nr:rho guanine nucleotide exchange factor 1 [Poecile atricapillus]